MLIKNKKVTIALIQMKCVEDKEKNLRKSIDLIKKAARKNAQIICLPELFSSLYFPQTKDHEYFKYAETIPGQTTHALSKLAADEKITLIASIFEKRTEGLYHNTAVVINENGKIIGKYRKMHIPDDPGYYEKYYFTPGDLGFLSLHTKYAKIGVLICWDQWFPEAARLTALSGAQILFYPTAIGWDIDAKSSIKKEQFSAWQTIQRSHAIANGIFVASINRIGRENKLDFWGGSFITNPMGNILSSAQHNKEEIIIAQCNLKQIDETRKTWPFLRDRRIDAYKKITSRFLD
jgi:N-carbamoylputrescine amidase